MRYSKKQLSELEDSIANLGYTIRFAKGSFSSNLCVIKNTKMILVNSLLNAEGRFVLLKELYNSLNLAHA
jgi:hypothetical protein